MSLYKPLKSNVYVIYYGGWRHWEVACSGMFRDVVGIIHNCGSGGDGWWY